MAPTPLSPDHIMETVAVIVGRFQMVEITPELEATLKDIVKSHTHVMLFLRNSPIPGHRAYPLPFVARRQMLQTLFPEMVILPLPDMYESFKWVTTLEARVREVFPMQSARLYLERDESHQYTDNGGKMKVTETPLGGLSKFPKEIVDSADFRRGVAWASINVFTKVLTTVDFAVIRGNSVLLGQKPNEIDWRFGGGFAETRSDTDEIDVCREMEEEFGLLCKPEDLFTIGRINVNDWRYRGSGDQIRTGLYLTFDAKGEPKPGDDIARVQWVNIDANPEKVPILPAHRHLWELLVKARHTVFKQRS